MKFMTDVRGLTTALEALIGRPYPLPFQANPVSTSAKRARAVREAFQHPLESLAADSLVAELAEALIDETSGTGARRAPSA